MMEVTNNVIATIYHRVDVDELGKTLVPAGHKDENGIEVEQADHG